MEKTPPELPTLSSRATTESTRLSCCESYPTPAKRSTQNCKSLKPNVPSTDVPDVIEVDVVVAEMAAAAVVVAASVVVAEAADLAATPRKMAALADVVEATDSAMAAVDTETETPDATEDAQDRGLDPRLGERVHLQSTMTIRMDIKCLFQGSKFRTLVYFATVHPLIYLYLVLP